MTVAIIILAAGLSRRMGDDDKVRAPVGGKPLYLYALEAALESSADDVMLVHGAKPLSCPSTVQPVLAKDAAKGQAHSLAAGIETAGKAKADAALVMLADMPLMTAKIIDALIDAARSAPDAIWRMRHNGQPGHPVYWPKTYFAALASQTGDDGARPVLKRHKHAVRWRDWHNDAVLFDVDTPARLDEARNRLGA